MFYYLYLRFHTENHLFNLFRYITFRTAYASMTALVLSLVLGPWVIERLKKFQIGQYIREDGPQSHQSKAGTPTMGGILINLCIVVPTLMWADLSNFFVWLVLGVTLAFGAIGDPITVPASCRRNMSRRAWAKKRVSLRPAWRSKM